MNIEFGRNLTERENPLKRRKGESLLSAVGRKLWQDKVLYLMLIPTLVFFFVFRVGPIINMRLAFYNFRRTGPWEFVGLHHFRILFDTPVFYQIIRNTLIISFMRIVLLFPFVVAFAILLNEIRSNRFRKFMQIISYVPNFFSWVVIASIWITFLSPRHGAVNDIITLFGFAPVDFMTNRDTIRWVLFFSLMWRSIGWDSIIYLTTIFGISPDLFEAAELDGAGRLRVIKSIILPALYPAMATIFILNLGFFLSAGFEQIFNFTNDAVNSVVDIIDTYVWRIGFLHGQFSLASAVNLLKGIFGVLLILATHLVSKRFTGKGVW